ncbi:MULTISPECIES: dihydrolipoyl dehydrogenase family protein [Kocuria]|uniref:dihydrolipoyl dehydrogenase family protein n=1 Tax=Kocuria TaxID=57493 RepID=UPI0013955228|nr:MULTISPECIES: NAD(P)/FAD-dependent oxidoreductase [Kocuria]MCT1545563.1 NAD(P)/FAD-dependent oxidoreductase [Kocuria rhizophila]MCT2171521.1 NAD(P)/FAD-dependent oxidoreductase [Kocuria rhizophila]MDN3461948.1 NAD(P)/FAD-dependent oxidoreductase [Kocuria sp. APC 4018]MXN63243.1 pyridine nucleotide-disulfide oxidoreductase [Bacillus sp. BGMRC0062]
MTGSDQYTPGTASAEEDVVDVVVIGGGPAGENVAQYAHDGGLSSVVVEESLMGGDCSYYACMPSKALLRPVEVANTAAHLQGVDSPSVRVDELLARRDAWVSHYDDAGQVRWAQKAGLGVVRGRGELVAPRTVRVSGPDGERLLTARRAVVLATGSSAVAPPALEGLHAWSSQDATGVVEVPESIAIVGGGVVAVEAATWLAALGSSVTLLVRGGALLAKNEPFVGELVLASLRDAGVDVRLGTTVEKATRENAEDTGLGRVHGGVVHLTISRDGSRGELAVSEVLVATGRTPRLTGLGLETVGATPEDVRAGTLPEWLHTVGDASGAALLTHMGKYEARVLGAKLAGTPESAPPAVVPVPQAVFTDPPVGAVGMTEAEAREAGHGVVVAEAPITGAAGAALMRDDAAGRAKLVVDEDSGCLLGATFVGPEATELVHGASIAIVGQVPVKLLRHAVPSYPTVSEIWLRLLEELPVSLR